MKTLKLMGAGLILAGSALVAHSAAAVTVNCAAGQTIAGALAAADNDDDDDLDETITVKGTCVEDVTLAADGLALKGHDRLGGRIEGSITVDGARRVSIENLEVAGSAAAGILVTNGAVVAIAGSSVSDSADENILVIQGSNAVLTGTEISGGFNGIVVARNSAVWLKGGNSVSGSIEEAVFVQQSSSFRAGVGAARDGFAASTGVMAVKEVSSLDVRNADITCEAACIVAVDVSGGGTFRTRSDVKITGNVVVGAGSGVRLQGFTLSGDLVCNPGAYGFGGVGCP